MTISTTVVGIFAFLSVVFLLVGMKYRTRQREIMNELELDGTSEAFKILAVNYLRGVLPPVDPSVGDVEETKSQLHGLMDRTYPAYQASRMASRFMLLSFVSVVVMLVAAIVSVLGY